MILIPNLAPRSIAPGALAPTGPPLATPLCKRLVVKSLRVTGHGILPDTRCCFARGAEARGFEKADLYAWKSTPALL